MDSIDEIGSLSALSELRRTLPVLDRWRRRDDVWAVARRVQAAMHASVCTMLTGQVRSRAIMVLGSVRNRCGGRTPARVRCDHGVLRLGPVLLGRVVLLYHRWDCPVGESDTQSGAGWGVGGGAQHRPPGWRRGRVFGVRYVLYHGISTR
jgi:hypothetical protein